MNQPTPADRDRAQRRVRLLTVATAAGAGVLSLSGAALAAGTFAGHTVAASQAQATPTDPATGLQQPPRAPGDGSGASTGAGATPIISGGS